MQEYWNSATPPYIDQTSTIYHAQAKALPQIYECSAETCFSACFVAEETQSPSITLDGFHGEINDIPVLLIMIIQALQWKWNTNYLIIFVEENRHPRNHFPYDSFQGL